MYKTRDLYEAGAISLFAKVKEVELIENDIWFVFETDAQKISDKYWTYKLTGGIREYAVKIKELKNMILTKKSNRGQNKNG